MTQSQAKLEERIIKRIDCVESRLDRVEEKVDAVASDLAKVKLAVVDLFATEKHMRNLVRELQGQGIALDEQKIFAA
jgi:hypothetical protein